MICVKMYAYAVVLNNDVNWKKKEWILTSTNDKILKSDNSKKSYLLFK